MVVEFTKKFNDEEVDLAKDLLREIYQILSNKKINEASPSQLNEFSIQEEGAVEELYVSMGLSQKSFDKYTELLLAGGIDCFIKEVIWLSYSIAMECSSEHYDRSKKLINQYLENYGCSDSISEIENILLNQKPPQATKDISEETELIH